MLKSFALLPNIIALLSCSNSFSNNLVLRTTRLFLLCLALASLSFACQSGDPTAGLADAELSDEQLAQRYCASCHLFPEPELLDRDTWRSSVLPAMSWRLGIRDTSHRPLMGRNMNEQFLIRQANVFPDSALLSEASWERIVDYYDSLAPSQLPVSTAVDHSSLSAAPFAPQTVSLGLSTGGLTTLLRQHPETGDIYLADGTLMLYQLDASGEVKDFFELPAPVSDVHFRPDGSWYILTVGNLNPHDEPLGKLIAMDPKGNSKPLIEDLNRPVHLNVHDLDQDGQEDMIISEFGNYLGRLSWFRQVEGGTYEKNVLWENPGAVRTIVRDLDQDGRPDIIALMAQGREGVYGFYNQGDGHFGVKPLLQFSSIFGSSDFTLADIDQDGDEDLLLANGDNADFSPVLKPYHGVRVYRNEGDYEFVEAYFYPMYGATRILSRDFDADGDLDIAASAYFPDFSVDDPQTFVYLENTGTDSLTFTPRTLNNFDQGRWLVMEPMQQNGRLALMLGAFNLGLGRGLERKIERWRGENVNMVMLKTNEQSL